jgi:ankyrin repeat protein/truncated hemoglobin YjbI
LLHTAFPELRHRGVETPEYAPPALWDALGGREGIEALVADFYQRMSGDPTLQSAFPRFDPGGAAEFFVQWFGGDCAYADRLEGGLARRHAHRFISPAAAKRWIFHLREAVGALGLEPQAIVAPLGRIAARMVNSAGAETAELQRTCDGVRHPLQVRAQELLGHVARGRGDEVRRMLAHEPDLARTRGLHGQTAAWSAVYHRRDDLLALALDAGADVNTPACDPPQWTMACDRVRMGTGLSATPLALARRWRPRLVPLLQERGAHDDVFTAAWLGDLDGLRAHLDRTAGLLHALDPSEDFQEVTPLAHAVCGGSLECVRLLLDRGAEVTRHSGKLLLLAVLQDRPDLVQLLIERGADVQRVDLLGRLDGEERQVADLLVAQGKRPPDWMLPRACRPDVSSNELHRVRVLLDYGASVDDRGRYAVTGLHYAVRGGKLPLIHLLLDRGAKVNARDGSGLTPLLHLAKTRANFDPGPVVELLAAHGAEVNARDERGATLLMHYFRRGDASMVRRLLALGAEPDTRYRR